MIGLLGIRSFEAWPAYITALFITGLGLGLGLAWSFPSVAAQGVVPRAQSGAVSGTVLTVLVGAGGVLLAVTATSLERWSSTTGQKGGIDAVLLLLSVIAAIGTVLMLLSGRLERRSTAMERAPTPPG